MESLIYAILSMLTIMGNSLAATKVFKSKDYINASSATALSLFPAFIIALIAVPFISYEFKINEIGLMALKNGLYGMAFFLRLEGLKKLGAFAGAVLLTAQPILVSLLGWAILGESLSLTEVLAVSITVPGLLLVNQSKTSMVYSKKNIMQFLALPATLLALVMIADRHLLIGEITGLDFFFIDKLMLLPAFLISIFLSTKLGSKNTRISVYGVPKSYLFKYLVILGGLWTISSLFYGLALEMEKTFWVAIIRSLAFPLVAVLGSLGKSNFNKRAFAGLILVTTGSLICSIY